MISDTSSKAVLRPYIGLWDEFPENDPIFWLSIVAYCRKRGGESPKELEPVSDVSLIADRILQMERRKVIHHWNAVFQQNQLGTSSSGSDLERGVFQKRASPFQLRLKLQNDKAMLESNRADRGWIKLTRKAAEQMMLEGF